LLSKLIRIAGAPLPDLHEPAFGALFDRFDVAWAVARPPGRRLPGEGELYPFGL